MKNAVVLKPDMEVDLGSGRRAEVHDGLTSWGLCAPPSLCGPQSLGLSSIWVSRLFLSSIKSSNGNLL